MKLKPWIHSALHIGCVALLLLQGHRIRQMQRTERLIPEAVVQRIQRDPTLIGRLFLEGFNGPKVSAGFSGSKLKKECWCDPWGQQNTDTPNGYFCTCPFGTVVPEPAVLTGAESGRNQH
jgi:hypothetical protein